MAAISSNGTGGGNWSIGATWVGGVPPTNIDDITIVNGDTVTIDITGCTCKSLILNGTDATHFATLQASTIATSDLTCGNASAVLCVTMNKYAQFNVGTAGTPLSASFTFTLNLNPSAAGSTFSLVQFAAMNWYGAIGYNANSQVLTVAGTPYTCGTYDTKLASDAASAQANLVFTTDIGLRVGGGDKLVVCTSNTTTNSATQHETVTTLSYTPATKTAVLTGNLTNLHKTGGRVVNMTRNVTIQASNTAKPATINCPVGAGTTTLTSTFERVQFINVSYPTPAANSTAAASFNQFVQDCSGYWNASAQATANSYMTLYLNNFLYSGFITTNGQACTYYNCGKISANGNNYFFNGAVQYSVTNCWTVGAVSATNMAQACTASVFTGCDMAQGSAAVTSTNINNTFTTCTFSYVTLVIDNANTNTFNNCTFTGCTYLVNNNPFNNIVRNGVYNTSFTTATQPVAELFNTLNYIGSIFVKESNCLLSDGVTLVDRTSFNMALNTKYNAASSPTAGVFPLPSGSSYVSQMSQFQANIAKLPPIIRYAVPITNGSTFTFTVPVFTDGWTIQPTNANLYLLLTVPGTTTTVQSTQAPGANDQWTFLTATATASATGFLVCDVYCFPYEVGASRSVYVDFPLGMAQSGLIWYDGQPSQQLTPLSQTSTADVWNYLAANATTAGTMGKKVNDNLTTSKFIGLK